jgi:hypothetical protein
MKELLHLTAEYFRRAVGMVESIQRFEVPKAFEVNVERKTG